jgi:hypothetical protein
MPIKKKEKKKVDLLMMMNDMVLKLVFSRIILKATYKFIFLIIVRLI